MVKRGKVKIVDDSTENIDEIIQAIEKKAKETNSDIERSSAKCAQ